MTRITKKGTWRGELREPGVAGAPPSKPPPFSIHRHLVGRAGIPARHGKRERFALQKNGLAPMALMFI